MRLFLLIFLLCMATFSPFQFCHSLPLYQSAWPIVPLSPQSFSNVNPSTVLFCSSTKSIIIVYMHCYIHTPLLPVSLLNSFAVLQSPSVPVLANDWYLSAITFKNSIKHKTKQCISYLTSDPPFWTLPLLLVGVSFWAQSVFDCSFLR